jgi:hypothetical protein
MSTQPPELIYVELDVLLDTRLGTLAKQDPELAKRVLEKGDYRERKMDCFEDISIEEFAKLYKLRDKDTLKHSVVTAGAKLIQLLASNMLADQMQVEPKVRGVKLIVNTAPYELTAEETDLFGRSIAVRMNGICEVEMTSVSQQDLTPSFCKGIYKMMLMYNALEWMELHTKEFYQTKMRNTLLLSPAIFYERLPTAQEAKKISKEVKGVHSPHHGIEILAMPIIELRFIDVEHFSIVRPD